MESFHHIETDLLIIGSGMAGMSGALFAANRKIKTVLVGGAGGFEYSSGLLDLWGKSLTRKERITLKPWDMLAKLPQEMPDHPLAKLTKETLKQAFSELIASLKAQGLTYGGRTAFNTLVITPFGTLKPCYRLPVSMQANAEAFRKKSPCLILDFKGLREFSATFLKEVLKQDWPDLKTSCIEFPDTQWRSEVFTPFLARSMETQQVREKFVRLVKPLLRGVTCLGMPAVLSVHSSDKVLNFLETELGVQIFEIPTSPVSVAGLRLKEAMLKALEGSSVTVMPNQRVAQVVSASDRGFDCRLGSGINPVRVHAGAVLLATGRFLGKGLVADQQKIHEPVFNLPVVQPKIRNLWHGQDYFSPGGHKINQAGIETDAGFRPITPDRQVVFNSLFAAGSILAHQDWIRNKCGAGLSIGTSFHAVQSYLQIHGKAC
jgi:glycerol-3-phosphate dehydrogenase subunit B